MSLVSADLPSDPEALRAFALACQSELAAATAKLEAAKLAFQLRTLEIEKLKFQIAKLRRMQFGRSSERLNRQIAQLELRLEELEAGKAEEISKAAAEDRPLPLREGTRPKRKPLPDHLPRQEVVHEPEHDGASSCPACGGAMAWLGEDVTEVLDYVPGRFRITRHVRPKYACRRCEAITQAPWAFSPRACPVGPALPTPRGHAAPGMLAHLLVSKYADHLPLYRQSEIYAREGVKIDRSTLSDWVGQAAWLLQPIVEGIGRHVFAAEKIHGDDTPVPVLEPGLGRTRTGRLWVYVRDDRPFCGPAPPAAVYFYSPDRGGEHPAAHLAGFKGFLQADTYSGFAALYELRQADPRHPAMAAITEVACWSHCRRGIFEVWKATKSPVARAALDRVAEFYAIEDKARFAPPAERLAHRAATIPLPDAFFAWAEAVERKLSARSELAEALRYILKRRIALSRFATDARLEADNNIAENAIRGIALGRRNWLFAGSHSGGARAAALYSLLQTAKLNGVNPEAYLALALARIAAGHPISRITDLLPWNLSLGYATLAA
ncbi:MAG: IS66 family transposase [Stellaceae bacterium]